MIDALVTKRGLVYVCHIIDDKPFFVVYTFYGWKTSLVEFTLRSLRSSYFFIRRLRLRSHDLRGSVGRSPPTHTHTPTHLGLLRVASLSLSLSLCSASKLPTLRVEWEPGWTAAAAVRNRVFPRFSLATAVTYSISLWLHAFWLMDLLLQTRNNGVDIFIC